MASAAAAVPGDLAAYMRARAADADGRSDLAARDYAAALAAAPDNPLVALRAYRDALDAGDDALADRAAAVLQKAGVAPTDAAPLALAAAARAHDRAAADAALTRIAATPFDITLPALHGWQALEQGRDPLAPLATLAKNAVARRLDAENRALLLIASGKAGQGVPGLLATIGLDQTGLDLRYTAAQLLAGQGDTARARSLLDTDNAILAGMRGNIRPAKGDLAFGASRLFMRIASELAAGDPSPLQVALLRASLRADPDNDRARLLLASLLSRRGMPARALAELDRVDPAGPFAAIARTSRITVLAAGDDDRATLAAARALAARADATPFDVQRYGQQLLAASRLNDAVAAYKRVVDADPGDWGAWMQYGGALDQAKRWPEARRALTKAVALAPDEPLALNYLGYSQIEHGEDIAASQAMLEKAARLKPDDASIADSLAWAYFQRGETARALPMLERAAEGEPDNAIIAEHLGDAYWSQGRRYEARYAWRAAALLAERDDAARLAVKIADGPARRR